MKREMRVVGIDIAKRVFHLVGMDERGKIVMRTRCSRDEVLPLMANLAPATVGMEACGGAHDWARRLHEIEMTCSGHCNPVFKEAPMLASVSYSPRRKVASLALQYCGAILHDIARPLHLEFPGALYHLMSHDNGGIDMYLDDWDREAF